MARFSPPIFFRGHRGFTQDHLRSGTRANGRCSAQPTRASQPGSSRSLPKAFLERCESFSGSNQRLRLLGEMKADQVPNRLAEEA